MLLGVWFVSYLWSYIMKLTLTAPASAPRQTGSTNETLEARQIRMKAFWADPQNAKLYTVGKLLSVVHDGKTLAQHLANGADFEMDSITIAGRTFPLQDGFKLSLESIGVWGCPACRSAHGSGIKPSPAVSAKLLATCKFFYNPATRALFTISTTCWEDYVKGMNAATPARFVAVPSAPASVPANVPKVPQGAKK